MIAYDLSRMKSAEGSPLRYEVDDKVTELAIRISYMIESMPVYKRLAERLPSPRLLLYFQYVIRFEIYPFVCQGCVIRWHKGNGKQVSAEDAAVYAPSSGISLILKECWDFEDIPLKLTGVSIPEITAGFPSRIIAYAKGAVKKAIEGYIEFKRSRSFILQETRRATIACHYAEGFDPLRRNDLNWYPESGIDPERVLIYFDSLNNKTGRLIDKNTIRQIEGRGLRWVALKKDIIEGAGYNYWNAPRCRKGLEKNIVRDTVGDWVFRLGEDFLRQVEYWRSFHKAFNIKVNYIPEEGTVKNLAQAAAFDIDNETHGLLAGRQRSEAFQPYRYILGNHPKHVFFMWNKRAVSYLDSRCERIEQVVLTGYPNDIFKKLGAADSVTFSQSLKAKGAKFIIALFDNAHGYNTYISIDEMTEFYSAFLKLILDNSDFGLVIKSKKPSTINNLSSIQQLLKEAIKTDRCIRLEDEWGRFPSDASMGADMAVGVSISSAVIEAVIGGCRGIHYDMTRLKAHEFYKWGYERIIFDDLERMMAAIKRYKENPANEPALGDWSLYMDQLDPFRDGRGGERMGTYMRWLMEAFDNGKDRGAAILYANGRYARQWGEDKIIDMRHKNMPEAASR